MREIIKCLDCKFFDRRIKDEDFGHVHWITGCRDYRGIRKQSKVLA